MVWKAPNLVEQQARWLDFLGEFDFEIIYRPGARHRKADALFRRRCRTCTVCQSGVDGGEVEDKVTGVVETPSAGSTVSEVWKPIELAAAQATDPELAVVHGWRTESEELPP